MFDCAPADGRLERDLLGVVRVELDDIAVDQPQTPDTGTHERRRDVRSERTDPDQEGTAAPDPVLAFDAERREAGLLAVAVPPLRGRYFPFFFAKSSALILVNSAHSSGRSSSAKIANQSIAPPSAMPVFLRPKLS